MLVTVSVTVCSTNVAVTFFAWLIFTMQDSAPVQAPFQLAKLDPASGIAVSVTTAPLVKLALHAAPQLIPPGLEATIPVPAPSLVTLSMNVLGSGATAKDAVTPWAEFIVTEQLPVPLQAPLQPAKVEPEAAAAVNVTLVPELKLALQVAPQLIPEGEEVTDPLPVPVLVTVRP